MAAEPAHGYLGSPMRSRQPWTSTIGLAAGVRPTQVDAEDEALAVGQEGRPGVPVAGRVGNRIGDDPCLAAARGDRQQRVREIARGEDDLAGRAPGVGDVGVVERGEQLRLALEAGQARRVVRQLGRQQLERATSRSSLPSVARCTSPIQPAPSEAVMR